MLEREDASEDTLEEMRTRLKREKARFDHLEPTAVK